MSKIIEAKAIISAADKTGNVFDKIAQKFKGVEKSAKALEGIKPPKFTGDMFKELERLKLTEKELQGVRKEHDRFQNTLRAQRPQAQHYFRAMDEWKGRTVNHWRDVKAAVDDTDRAHGKFFKRAGHFALHAAGIGTAAYATGHALRSGAEAAAKRNRAGVRFEQMGLSDGELGEGNEIASAISAKFPSISRTEVLDYLRANTARLGSFERSKEVAEPYARALIANKLSGGDAHEMEQIVRALEGMGKANTAGQITKGLNAFARAKAANPDYTGEQFRQDMASAASAKYALSDDYMENIFPVLASHTSGFGNKLATGFSALVGGRMKKEALGHLQAAGLADDNGKLKDEKGFIKDNFEWTQKHVKPLLEKKGVHFGEEMTQEDKSKVVQTLSKMFSAKNAADLIATNLLDAPLVEKMRHRKVAGLEDMDRLQKKDVTLQWEAVGTQLKDAAVAMTKLGPVVSALEAASSAFANIAKTAETGKVPENTPLGALIKFHTRPADTVAQVNDAHRREGLTAQLREYDQKLSPAFKLDDTKPGLDGQTAAGSVRLKRFEIETALRQMDELASMPQIFTDKEVEQLQEIDRERRRGAALSDLGKEERERQREADLEKRKRGEGPDNDKDRKRRGSPAGDREQPDRRPDEEEGAERTKPSGFGKAGVPRIPTPRARPAEAPARGAPPVQSLEGASPPMPAVQSLEGANVQATLTGTANVEGKVEGTFIVKAGSELLSIVEQMKKAIALVGTLNANGPGSTGKSSPDAAAPAVGSVGNSP